MTLQGDLDGMELETPSSEKGLADVTTYAVPPSASILRGRVSKYHHDICNTEGTEA